MSKEQSDERMKKGEERRDSNSKSLSKMSFNSFFPMDRVARQDIHFAPHHVILTCATYGSPLIVKKGQREMSDSVSERQNIKKINSVTH